MPPAARTVLHAAWVCAVLLSCGGGDGADRTQACQTASEAWCLRMHECSASIDVGGCAIVHKDGCLMRERTADEWEACVNGCGCTEFTPECEACIDDCDGDVPRTSSISDSELQACLDAIDDAVCQDPPLQVAKWPETECGWFYEE